MCDSGEGKFGGESQPPVNIYLAVRPCVWLSFTGWQILSKTPEKKICLRNQEESVDASKTMLIIN